MIPYTVDIIEEEETLTEPSLTYGINPITQRIQGRIDGEEAILQAIEKMLTTDRYAYEIYDWYYGNELALLVGKPLAYIETEAPRILKETLLQDDRILDIKNVTVVRNAIDALTVAVTVKTVFGDIAVTVEV